MRLTVKERILMPNICPIQGADIVTQILVRDLLKKVELTQPEMKKISFRQNEAGTGVEWKLDILPLKSITFTELELGALKNRVEKMDKEKKVSQELLSLCLKIRDEKVKPNKK